LPQFRRRLAPIALVLASALLVACGGGGGSSSVPPTSSGGTTSAPPTAAPTTAPAQTTQSTLVGSQAAQLTLPTIASGVGLSAALPATSSGSATLTATLSGTNPVSAAPAAVKRLPRTIGTAAVNPIAYLSLTATAAVAFSTTPTLRFTLPDGISAPNGYWAALFDTSQPSAGWNVIEGPVSISGTTVTFADSSSGFAMQANVQYVVVLFAPGGVYPTTAPSATPIPTPTSSSVACTSVGRVSDGLALRGAHRASGGVVPNRLVVSYRTAAFRGTDSVDRSVGAVRALDIGTSSGVTQRAITLPAGADLGKAAAQLRATAGVVDVQQVHYRSLTDLANDPLLNNDNQWYTYLTGVDVNPSSTIGANPGANVGAWQLTTGGSTIKIAVIDTGIDQTNQDLSAHLAKAESIVNGVTSTSAQDTNGHGTNVAGLAAAAANNGYGFAGVGYGVSLLAYKIFPDATTCGDDQTADTADEAAAINDAVASGANVISLSLGSSNYNNEGFDQTEYNAVENAINAGVTVVAANGNEFADAPATHGSVPDAPASYAGVIGVGASANLHGVPNVYSSITSETVASYSNSGPTLVAPGGDPSSSDPGSDLLNWIEGYSTTTAAYAPDKCSNSGGVCRALFAGTSQATPQVSGTIALMMAYHGGPIAPATVKSLLVANSDPIAGISSTRQGAGRLNAYKAVGAAR
jgi:subtilisin family serine protease